MAKAVTIKQGEAKTLKLTVTEDGAVVNLTGATLFLGVKKTKADAAYAFSKDDADFGKGQADTGLIKVFLSGTDTAQPPGPYVGELKVTYPGSPATIEKSTDLMLIIEEAVTG
jgi:hypothetical protein